MNILLTGPDETSRRERLVALADEGWLDNNHVPGLCYLGRSELQVSQFRESFPPADNRPGRWTVEAFTLEALPARVCSELAPEVAVLGQTARALVLEHLIDGLAAELRYFQAPVQPGVVRSVLDAFSVLVRDGWSSRLDEFKRRYGPYLGLEKTDDLMRLYRAYRAWLENSQPQRADRDHLRERAHRLLENGDRELLFPGLGVLAIDGPVIGDQADRNLLERFCALFQTRVFLLDQRLAPFVLDPPVKEPGYHFRRQLAYLEFLGSLGKQDNFKVVQASSGPVEPGTPAGFRVFVGIHSGRQAEVEAVAREVRTLAESDDPCPLDNILVAFPRPEDYLPIVENVFQRCGIPCRSTRGLPLYSQPVCQLVRMVLDAAEGRRTPDLLFDLFAHPLVRVRRRLSYNKFRAWIDKLLQDFDRSSLADTGPPWWNSSASRDTLRKKYFLEAAGVGGNPGDSADLEVTLDLPALRPLWQRARVRGNGPFDRAYLWPVLKLLASRWRRAQADRALEGERAEELRRTGARALLQTLLLAGELDQLDKLSRVRSAVKAPEFLEELVCGRLQVLHSLLEGADSPETRQPAQTSLAALSRVLDLAREVADGLNALGGKPSAMFQRFSTTLKRELHSARFHIPRQDNAVCVCSAAEADGVVADRVFLAGLLADDFPTEHRPSFVLDSLPSPDLESAPQGGIFQPDHQDQARHLFYHLLRNTRLSLCLGYPEIDREGKGRMPSPLLLDHFSPESADNGSGQTAFRATELAREASGGKCPELVTVRAGEFSGADDRIWSFHDFYCRLAGADPAAVRQGLEKADSALLDTGDLLHRLGAARSRQEKDFGPYEGIFASPAILEELSRFLLGQKTLSVTALESYAACPMSFFFRRLLGLEAPLAPDDDLSPLERGSFVHRVLELFYLSLGDNNNWTRRDLKGADPEEVFHRHMLTSLDAALREVSFPENAYLARERQLLTSGLLFEFVREQASQDPPYEFVPFRLETSFGRQGTAVSAGPLCLSGKIDRIDRSRGHGHSLFCVADYKTGAAPGSNQILRGLAFQLPVYLLAARGIIENEESDTPDRTLAPVGAFYYELDLFKTQAAKRGGFRRAEYHWPKSANKRRLEALCRFHGLDCRGTGDELLRRLEPFRLFGGSRSIISLNSRAFDNLLEHTVCRLDELGRHMLAGRYHYTLASPADVRCSFCDYSSLCRVDLSKSARIHRRLAGRGGWKFGEQPAGDCYLPLRREQTGLFRDSLDAGPRQEGDGYED